MVGLVDRVAYRLAGIVWTTIYSGLCSRSGRDGNTATQYATVETTSVSVLAA